MGLKEPWRKTCIWSQEVQSLNYGEYEYNALRIR